MRNDLLKTTPRRVSRRRARSSGWRWIGASALVLCASSAAAQQGDLGFTPPPKPETVEAQSLDPTETTGPAPFSGGERADRDPAAAEELDGAALWRSTQEAAGPVLEAIDLGLVVLTLAAAVGGFLGARVSARRRVEPALADHGFAPEPLEFGRGDDTRALPSLGPIEPTLSSEPDEPALPPPPERREEDDEKVEAAERLLAFFQKRFDVDTTTADDAIDYLTRLGSSVDGMRRKLAVAETELERLRTAARGEPDGAVAAAWDLIGEAGRSVRAAGQGLRSDPDYVALAHEAQIEESMRELGALRLAFVERKVGIEPEVIEDAWPHALLRAEALTSAYYPTTEDWRDLRFGLTAAATAFRTLLRNEGVFVDHARLLTDLVDGEGEIWSDTSDGLRELRPVRQTVLTTAGAGDESFVIDCESFGFFDRERDLQVRSKVIVFNRAEWR